MKIPCNHQPNLSTLTPITNPISIRLRMMDTARYQGVGPPEELRPQQTNPKINPKRVAMRNLFMLNMGTSFLIKHKEYVEVVNPKNDMRTKIDPHELDKPLPTRRMGNILRSTDVLAT